MRHAALIALTAAFLAVSMGYAQGPGQNQAFTCVANAGTPAIVRVEGITELVGDLLLQCKGGTPTTLGQKIPVSNVTLTLNTNVTSRLIGGSYIDALLLLDEPSPQQQLPCGAPNTGYNGDGTCTIAGNGTGAGLYDGTPGHPNIFVGQFTGPNRLTFFSPH